MLGSAYPFQSGWIDPMACSLARGPAIAGQAPARTPRIPEGPPEPDGPVPTAPRRSGVPTDGRGALSQGEG